MEEKYYISIKEKYYKVKYMIKLETMLKIETK